MDLERALQKLHLKRRIFNSEADFQFALAWEIQQEYPDSSVRLEYIPFDHNERMHVDIWVIWRGEIIPIEIKHFALPIKVFDAGEACQLKYQGAEDNGRYDFIKDITRIEGLVYNNNDSISRGYVLLLTNDYGYWLEPKRTRVTNDIQFRIHSGKELSGTMSWLGPVDANIKDSRNPRLTLRNAYSMDWKDYHNFEGEKCGLFRYLLVKVGKSL